MPMIRRKPLVAMPKKERITRFRMSV